MNPLTWVLETEVFSKLHGPLAEAVRNSGYAYRCWDDEWWVSGAPKLEDRVVVFHGSLGNAARIKQELSWQPGAFCNVPAFHCTAWYQRAKEWLLHREWRVLSVKQLAENPEAMRALGETAFVRPDSPLKPFSGRVLSVDKISLAALDHGFYYDDVTLPVIVAPVRSVAREWRYVVVERKVVAGSAYAADGRTALADDPTGEPWRFAADVAARLEPPEEVYVMDVCEVDGELKLLELNPFSGADLYACKVEDVVKAVSEFAAKDKR